MASRVSLAWMVVIDPSWPVFMAWSMSRVSPPRHLADDDPLGPHPQGVLDEVAGEDLAVPLDVLAGRVSRRTTCSCWSFGVRRRPRSSRPARRRGMNDERAFMSVVLPEPVPPETTMLIRPRTARLRGTSTISQRDRLLLDEVGLNWSGFFDDFRIESDVPSIASGGMTALTREPSGNRASQKRRGLIHPPADPADDPADDLDQVPLVVEDDLGPAQAAAALDVDALRAVDQNVGDGRVAHQDLERADPEGLVEDLADQALALGHAQEGRCSGGRAARPRGGLRRGARPRSGSRSPRGRARRSASGAGPS